MAVQAQQQFLESAAPLLCNGGGSGHSGLGWVDGRGGRSMLEFYLPSFQKQLQQQQQVVMTMTGNQQRGPVGLSCPPPSTKIIPTDVSYCLVSQLDKQKREIDEFLRLQSERLRVALQQQMRDQLLALTRRLDSKASTLLKQKEEDLARASKKTLELEECLKRAEADGQTWKRIARENEAMALALQNTLEQVRDNPCRSSAGGVIPATAALGDDAASCCDSTSATAAAARPNGGKGEGNRDGEGQGIAASGRCRGCGSHDSCMLFMPCMHLCACELCASLLDSCPVCRSAKQGSIEVFLS